MSSTLLLEGRPGTVAPWLPEARLCRRVDEALEVLEGWTPSALVTDLAAEDGPGPEGLARLEPTRRTFPVVAWVPADQAHLEEEALAAGASEFLAGAAREELLRALRRAGRRHEAWRRVLEDRPRMEAALAALDETLRREQALPQWGGLPPLAEGAPGHFSQVVERYGDLLDRAAGTVEGRVNGDARHLAEELGLLRAGPVDLVEIHKAALEARSLRPLPEARRYVGEGRLLLLQVMGWLADYYRTRSR